MGLIQNLVRKMKGDKDEFKSKFKEFQEDKRINELVEERSKSSNRRELERYLKEQEEAQIKMELSKIRKKQNRDIWNSPNKILGGKTTMIITDRPILKEKNIFANSKKIPFIQKGGMFFK